ncbi:MAG: 30S ribosomal protein S20 [Candidatus Wildermuthbacteria bacterium]|nr:30S ribosomal protein S20 [Candidatus Wildermuthbacteria bacterium]
MAITKSAKKAARQSIRRKIRNIKRKDAVKTLLKEVKKLVAAKKTGEAQKLLPQLQQALDKGAKAGIIKKNTASRNKSRIAKLLKKNEG